jgi:hypothetical protein
MLFVYIFAGLIILLVILTSMMPKGYNIEKTVVIHQPVETVMEHVGNLNHYREWNVWQQIDASAKSTITGTPNEKGHRYKWEGKKVGIGSLTLLNRDEKHINFDLDFIRPWKTKAKDNWLFEHWGVSDTKVTWQNSGDLPWSARLMGPMLTKSLNKTFEKGLQNLKNLCETGKA